MTLLFWQGLFGVDVVIAVVDIFALIVLDKFDFGQVFLGQFVPISLVEFGVDDGLVAVAVNKCIFTVIMFKGITMFINLVLCTEILPRISRP